jgi:class 3 adenylate cyclase
MGTDKTATLLVVDDMPANLEVLSRALSAEYRVKAATSGARALRICSQDPLPDLILLDVMMPEMDGKEVCRQLKADPRTADIPVIFVTANSETDDETEGFEIGAVDYITKPIRPPVVLKRVRLQLALRRTQLELAELSQRYSSYLSPLLSSSIRRGEVAEGVVSQRKDLTLFFSDIVGFTRQTAQLDPAVMARLLNHYFQAMTDIIHRHQGTLDKYIGDAILVFFGDPVTRGPEQDAVVAVRMALEMQAKLAELQPLWREAGLGESLAVRMGIASGPCFVGNFGAERQLSYTVLGTPVNLAARLQVRAQPGQVLICAATRDLVQGQIECVPNAPFVAHGLTGEIANYSAVLR